MSETINPETTPVLDPAANVAPMFSKPPVEITEEQKENFFKSFLADKPYQEEFSLLQNNYKIVFKTLTMRENGDILKQIAFDRDLGKADGVSDYYFSRVVHYRLALSIVSINDKPFADELNPQTCPDNKQVGTSYVSARADLFQDWTMLKMATIQTALVQFDQRVAALLEGVAKPDFWKAAV